MADRTPIVRKRKDKDIDLGHGHSLRFTRWAPDDLPENRQRYGFPLPKIERLGAIITHHKPDGSECWSHIYFDTPKVRKYFTEPKTHFWQVQSWNPLTISPSLLCLLCQDHGFIRDGKWVPA